MNLDWKEKLGLSASYLKSALGGFKPDLLVILGSGFRAFAEQIRAEGTIDVTLAPHFPVSSVKGHGNQCIIGEVHGVRLAILSGRVHLYEGFSAHQVVYSVRLFWRLGIRNLLLTNASGGLHSGLTPGDIVVVKDQINLTGENCLIGDWGADVERFVDMNYCYDTTWKLGLLRSPSVAGEEVYLGLKGPSYETAAETKAFRSLGAGLVGMSTVQECIAARQLGIRVAALSLVTNLTGGLSSSVNHQDVLATGERSKSKLVEALQHAIKVMPKEAPDD